MGLSLGHLIVVLIIVLVLFGAGRLSRVMGELGRGIKSFKEGLNANEDDKPGDKTIERKPPPDDQRHLPPQ